MSIQASWMRWASSRQLLLRLLPALSPAALVLWPLATGAISFTYGHYYTTNYFSRVITEYNAAGHVLGSLTLPFDVGGELRGLAFGPDGLMYVTAARTTGFAVLALDSAGAVQQTYE